MKRRVEEQKRPGKKVLEEQHKEPGAEDDEVEKEEMLKQGKHLEVLTEAEMIKEEPN